MQKDKVQSFIAPLNKYILTQIYIRLCPGTAQYENFSPTSFSDKFQSFSAFSGLLAPGVGGVGLQSSRYAPEDSTYISICIESAGSGMILPSRDGSIAAATVVAQAPSTDLNSGTGCPLPRVSIDVNTK